ncbi:MAG TPA: aminoacyl-histidine dipeptidase [Tenuifilaceae bacterium]|nr:aminoacyl-histidine dipeptidase [Tenuifilaceae bacterium]HRX32594.1 aminoacyl-histidine dipeptidase [Tenuifilaceae bacterium]
MDKEIFKLDPQCLWKNFYSLTQHPRPSKKEKAVVDFVVKFGKDLGLETKIDGIGNVIIRKPATPGMENRKGVILQGHLDMVPQKNSDKVHDFEKDPIEAYIDGEWVTANGTTLGADNGMGVAAAMTVLESKDIAHGPIEALFTIDEETGMTGAFGLKPGLFKGDILLNLDSEDEGELYVGCAGGLDANITFNFKQEAVPANTCAYKIALKGLKGGHSGMEINLGRANSIKLLFRFLYNAEKELNIRIASIDGGSLRNAIPREAFAVVVVPSESCSKFEKMVSEYLSVYKSEFSVTEPSLSFAFEKAEMPKFVIDKQTQEKATRAFFGCPNGVIRMSDSVPGLVETSNNLARVYTEGSIMMGQCLLRSSVETSKDALSEKIAAIFELAGANTEFTGGYPGWKPNPDSPILKTMEQVYQKKFGKMPEIKAIHAGLECGLLGGVYPNWDMISFGPTIRSPHSPDEKVNIATVKKFWEYLVEVLKNIPTK